MRRLLVVAISALPFVYCADIYVSPSGSSSGTGSISSPLKDIQAAVNKAVAGDTIYLRGGTYSPTTNIQITSAKKGTSSAPFTLRAYGTEKVVIDGEALPGTPAPLNGSLDNKDRGIIHVEGTAYWRFYNLELINGPYGIYIRDASNNIFDRLITHDNYESGFQLQGSSSNNLITNLDSYMNRDPRKNGESADGLAIKEGSGTGNVVRGARLWNNVDDGLDFWEFKSPITVENTIAWGNGVNRWGFTPFEGDGNGFKLGGGDAADIGPAAHVITNCIAFNNAVGGFVDNHQTGNMVLTRNTAYANGGTGFRIGTATASLTGNVAAGNGDGQSLLGSQLKKNSGNSWNGSTSWSASSFKSVDGSLVMGARQSDGSIVPSDFLLPKSGEAIGATTRL